VPFWLKSLKVKSKRGVRKGKIALIEKDIRIERKTLIGGGQGGHERRFAEERPKKPHALSISKKKRGGTFWGRFHPKTRSGIYEKGGFSDTYKGKKSEIKGKGGPDRKVQPKKKKSRGKDRLNICWNLGGG